MLLLCITILSVTRSRVSVHVEFVYRYPMETVEFSLPRDSNFLYISEFVLHFRRVKVLNKETVFHTSKHAPIITFNKLYFCLNTRVHFRGFTLLLYCILLIFNRRAALQQTMAIIILK